MICVTCVCPYPDKISKYTSCFSTRCKLNLFTCLSSGPSTSSQPAQLQAENSQGSLSTPAPALQPSSMEASSLLSPQLSPQVSPGSQLSEPTSDSAPMESCSPGPSPAPQSDPQGTSTGGEEEGEEVEEAKEAKRSNSKQLLHCPMCKVTVNSSSQLEAHYSGTYHNSCHTYQWCTTQQFD